MLLNQQIGVKNKKLSIELFLNGFGNNQHFLLLVQTIMHLSTQSSFSPNGFERLIASDFSAPKNFFQKNTPKNLHSSQKYSNFAPSLRI